MNQKNLGRGLSALFGDLAMNEETKPNSTPFSISIASIRAGKMQPRQDFNDEKMQTLTESVRLKGVLQPLLLRQLDEGYEIIAGERRWRAAQEAGLTEVPAIVFNCSDEEALQIGLIENLQRDDLNPIEEAESLQHLIDSFQKTQEQVAQMVSKSRSYVANLLRLNSLPESVKKLMRAGQLTAGHGRALIGLPNCEQLAQEMVSQGLSVREAEKIARQKGIAEKKSSKNYSPPLIDADAQQLAEKIGRLLKAQTSIRLRGEGISLKLDFSNIERFDDFVEILSKNLISDDSFDEN